MSAHAALSTAHCLPTRIARAGRHVDLGEWACGHAILAGLLACGRRGGCGEGDNCTAAAEVLLNDIRGLLDGDTSMTRDLKAPVALSLWPSQPAERKPDHAVP